MGILMLAVGSLLSMLFVSFIIVGKKYNPIVECLSGTQYPLKDLYVVGYVWNNTPLLKLRGNRYKKLREESLLIYGQKYRDYYAHLTWTQSITLAHLFSSVTFIFAGMSGGSPIFLLLTGILGAVIVMKFYSDMKNKLKTRSEECLSELPNVISKLALLTSSGMILREAWYLVSNSKGGVLYELMRITCEDMDNGASDVDAIHRFGVLCNTQEAKKFSSALIQSLEKGGSDLVGFLAFQSTEVWIHKKQQMLQKGEIAASKLVAPITLMFMGVMIIVLVAALTGM